MALPNAPLLSNATEKNNKCLPCKLTLAFTAVAAVCFFYLSSPHLDANVLNHVSELCTRSPDRSSCITVVSDAISGVSRPATLATFHAVLDKSRSKLEAAISDTERLLSRGNQPEEQSVLADCLHLMDLSVDHLTAAVVARDDARTWLSAALANHVTCRDGLDKRVLPEVDAHLRDLMALTSASLAVLNAIDDHLDNDRDLESSVQFPLWLSRQDRKLLEASGPSAIQANAVVAQDGSGKYKTVQAAVDASPNKGSARYVIYVKKGVYKETVRIDKTKTNLMILGDGMDSTVISGRLNFIDGTTTFNSATLAAVGTGLILQDLKIENTAGPEKHQAVALRVGADLSVINRCRIEAYQDTLYAHTLRQFYRDCKISGTVDFIFGDAAVVFQNCDLIARKPMSNQQNLVTAQGRTDPNENTGTSIQNCQVIPAPDLVPVIGSIPTYLGRPWKEYSRTVVMQSFIDRHVNPKGWYPWDGEFALKTLFYGEYMNKGPGAGTSGRVTWPGFKVITDANTALAFTVGRLIQGGSWLKSTGVDFTEGL